MTSTYALSNATTKYVKTIANLGLKNACEKSPEIISAVNTYDGYVTNEGIAEDNGYEYKELNIK